MKSEEKEKIIEMFFIEEMKQIDIATILNISKYKVSRVVTQDSRYAKEKERRMKLNKQKHIDYTKEYMKTKQKIKQLKDNSDNLILKVEHNQASNELSQHKMMTNIAYWNWNRSAYTYNKEKKRFEFKEELGRSFDVPKYIKVEVF